MSLNDFAKEIDEIALHAANMNNSATKTMAQSETGVKAIELLGEQFEKTRKLQDEAYSTVADLEERSRTIDDISQTINSIAEQTSLLALNASIELQEPEKPERDLLLLQKRSVSLHVRPVMPLPTLLPLFWRSRKKLKW